MDVRPAALPVPERAARLGLPKAPWLIVRVPERAPTTVGVNVTATVHVRPAPTLEPQVLPATAKSPLAATAETVKAAFRWFVTVTVLAALVVPAVRVANLRRRAAIVASE